MIFGMVLDAQLVETDPEISRLLTREKLAEVAGILLAYPGLNIAVGGYTDNVGSNQLNQTLSERRVSLRASPGRVGKS